MPIGGTHVHRHRQSDASQHCHGFVSATALVRRKHVETGGGLIGDGHPVGATGVRQVFEAYQQLTEKADVRQIENAKRFLTFNMGGSLTTSVAMLWGRS